MSLQLSASALKTARIHYKKHVPPPPKPNSPDDYELPFKKKVYLPSDFLLPVGGQIGIEDISAKHVYAWNHRYKKDLPKHSGSIPSPNEQEKKYVHSCAYWLKQETLAIMRKKIKTRMLELGRMHCGDAATNFTNYTQLCSYLHSEVEFGNGEAVFNVLYGRDSWAPSWEMGFAEMFCEENNLYFHGENVSEGKTYKGAFPRLATYELGQLRKRVKTVNRRQPQTITEDGKKVKRRDKYSVPFDPVLHVKATSDKSTAQKKNMIV